MAFSQSCLALIPARGGSKTVPHKNIKALAGKPLLAWTIEAALASSAVERVIVSTDSPEIREIACRWGAEVPFLRPDEYAQDTTPDLPVYLHALRWLAEHENYQPWTVAWLRPTTPLRAAADVDAAIHILAESGADCVRSVVAVDHHPYWMKTLDGNCLQPFIEGRDERQYYQRQLLPPAYRLNGVVDVTRCDGVLANEVLYGNDMRGYVMPMERSVDIDTALDFALAELMLNNERSE